MERRTKPLLIFDGDCGFCRRWIDRWRQITGDSVDYSPYQEVSARFPEIPQEAFKKSVQLVTPDGKVTKGAEAVFRSLAAANTYRWLVWAYTHIPGVAPLTEVAYAAVASNRVLFSSLTAFFLGNDTRRPNYSVSVSIFVRCMGAVYLMAFVSLAVQITGLVGSQGIYSAAKFLSMAQDQLGAARFWLLPTLAWFNASDAALRFFCWGGALVALLVFLRLAPTFSLFICWVFYLSIVSVGGPFLSFQWDALLLEAGFLAIFLPLDRTGLIRFLLKVLLFKLMFLSGFVKLESGDPVWNNLTALYYHYQTQPLPPWTAWYAHHLPAWFQRLSCLILFVLELGVPFLLFFPRRIRHAAAWALISLQLLILFTGNYAFFNHLTLALCLLLFEDTAWPAKWKHSSKKGRAWPAAVPALAAFLVVLISFGTLPALRAFHIANRYGLFAVMTVERPEIIVEGSVDGQNWQAYSFKYKQGDVMRRPAFVAPHQPRLDWQMWFAALGDYRQNRWFVLFCRRLLEGSPEVLGLLEKNPFPDAPPRYIRAVLYNYRFSTPKEKHETGAWWQAEAKRSYGPVWSLDGGGS